MAMSAPHASPRLPVTVSESLLPAATLATAVPWEKPSTPVSGSAPNSGWK